RRDLRRLPRPPPRWAPRCGRAPGTPGNRMGPPARLRCRLHALRAGGTRRRLADDDRFGPARGPARVLPPPLGVPRLAPAGGVPGQCPWRATPLDAHRAGPGCLVGVPALAAVPAAVPRRRGVLSPLDVLASDRVHPARSRGRGGDVAGRSVPGHPEPVVAVGIRGGAPALP